MVLSCCNRVDYGHIIMKKFSPRKFEFSPSEEELKSYHKDLRTHKGRYVPTGSFKYPLLKESLRNKLFDISSKKHSLVRKLQRERITKIQNLNENIYIQSNVTKPYDGEALSSYGNSLTVSCRDFNETETSTKRNKVFDVEYGTLSRFNKGDKAELKENQWGNKIFYNAAYESDPDDCIYEEVVQKVNKEKVMKSYKSSQHLDELNNSNSESDSETYRKIQNYLSNNTSLRSQNSSDKKSNIFNTSTEDNNSTNGSMADSEKERIISSLVSDSKADRSSGSIECQRGSSYEMVYHSSKSSDLINDEKFSLSVHRSLSFQKLTMENIEEKNNSSMREIEDSSMKSIENWSSKLATDDVDGCSDFEYVSFSKVEKYETKGKKSQGKSSAETCSEISAGSSDNKSIFFDPILNANVKETGDSPRIEKKNLQNESVSYTEADNNRFNSDENEKCKYYSTKDSEVDADKNKSPNSPDSSVISVNSSVISVNELSILSPSFTDGLWKEWTSRNRDADVRILSTHR